jgi:hypothetical protein
MATLRSAAWGRRAAAGVTHQPGASMTQRGTSVIEEMVWLRQ